VEGKQRERQEAKLRRAREIAAQLRKEEQRSQAIAGLKQLLESVDTVVPSDYERILQKATALSATADCDSEIQSLLQQINQAIEQAWARIKFLSALLPE
jgi:cell division GTPase FtsZ